MHIHAESHTTLWVSGCVRGWMGHVEATYMHTLHTPNAITPHYLPTYLHQRAEPEGRRLRDKGDVIPRQLGLVAFERLGANVLQRLQPRIGPQAGRALFEESVVDLRLGGAGRNGGGKGALGQLW